MAKVASPARLTFFFDFFMPQQDCAVCKEIASANLVHAGR
jgi:hypothetical protein